MIKELKQKDIDLCIALFSEKTIYDNLKTRMLAFLQADNNYAYGAFHEDELLGCIFFSYNSFDVTINLMEVKPLDEIVIKNLVSIVRKKTKMLGAKAIYVNYHNLTKELLNLLEILEQYRLE